MPGYREMKPRQNDHQPENDHKDTSDGGGNTTPTDTADKVQEQQLRPYRELKRKAAGSVASIPSSLAMPSDYKPPNLVVDPRYLKMDVSDCKDVDSRRKRHHRSTDRGSNGNDKDRYFRFHPQFGFKHHEGGSEWKDNSERPSSKTCPCWQIILIVMVVIILIVAIIAIVLVFYGPQPQKKAK